MWLGIGARALVALPNFREAAASNPAKTLDNTRRVLWTQEQGLPQNTD